ncbi:pyruvate kinase [Heliorestis acidaminivorans]|nr:pyruvate kinase [Heliorestis acidaminivorans]
MISEGCTSQEHKFAEELGTLYNLIATQALTARDKFPLSQKESEQSRDNLLAYIALRRHDLFDLQLELAEFGLSSLGRLEECVLTSIEKVLKHLATPVPDYLLHKTDSKNARLLASKRARKLFGRPRRGRNTRIMVTLDSSYSDHPELMEDLLRQGMDIARINCAHDHQELWEKMICSLREAEARLEKKAQGTGRKCRIIMDLGGPKIRTGPVMEKTIPLRLKVPRDIYGQPIRILEGYLDNKATYTELVEDRYGQNQHFVIAIEEQIPLDSLHIGEVLTFKDSRNRKRKFRVIERISPNRIKVALERTAYVQEGLTLNYGQQEKLTLGAPKALPINIEVQAGQVLRLYFDPHRQGHNATESEPASISCTVPEVLQSLHLEDPVFIDDGKIGARVINKQKDYVDLEVISPDDRSARIRPEKGLNFPESSINMPALTEQDRIDLEFIVANADALALSFIHRPQDLDDLRVELKKHNREDIGIVAKIETREAIHQLSRILLKGLDFSNFGIMIARGDLAVEVGFENLSLVQEDILCLCEAAHVPVIWATQVLENLAKKGLPARAEITDAAMSHRAECVMLNKGPHILDAVKTLSSLLSSEERYHLKKRQIFRDFTEQHDIF